MKFLKMLLFCVPFSFCMEPSTALEIGQEIPKEKVEKLKQLTPEQTIASGTLVVMKNGIYKVVKYEKECAPGFFQVIIKLEPRSGAIVRTDDIYLLKKS